jgi:hypothetical protein
MVNEQFFFIRLYSSPLPRGRERFEKFIFAKCLTDLVRTDGRQVSIG